MKKLFNLINDNFERWCMMLLFVALFLVVMAGIVSRSIFNNPFSWTEEAARLCFIWMVFLGISYGTKYDKHINVTILLDRMPRKVAGAFTILWDIVALIVFVWIAFYGIKYIIYSSTGVTPVLRINQGLTTSIVAVSAILNCYRIVEKMIREHIPSLKEAK